MKKTVIKKACSIGLAISILGGCAHSYQSEPEFGSEVRSAIANHVINPQGVGYDGVKPGMDGPSAKATVDRYIKSMEQPPSIGDVFRLGIGDSNTGSGVVTVPSTTR
jgi:hypothetical protein